MVVGFAVVAVGSVFGAVVFGGFVVVGFGKGLVVCFAVVAVCGLVSLGFASSVTTFFVVGKVVAFSAFAASSIVAFAVVV